MEKQGSWLRNSSHAILGACAVCLILALFVLHTTESRTGANQAAVTAPIPKSAQLLAASQAAEEASSGNAVNNGSSTPTISSAASTSPSSVASSGASNSPTAAASESVQSSSAAPQSNTQPANSTASAKALTAAGGRLLGAIVNIVCISDVPQIPTISGSGVIIDPRGIILTAAHVAQLFTLQDYLGTSKVECIVRDGSPARRAYLAEPIYVSPLWIHANPSTLDTTTPQGTGENDFALLGITATATSTPLPASYPYVPLSSEDPQINDPVAIGSYGAQYLTSSELNTSLYPILVFGSIQNIYTFHANTVDLVSILGSAASQEGSSGGGIVDAEGGLVGIITTSSISGDFSGRSLNAVTVNHMRRSYTADTGGSLDTLLQSNSVPGLIAAFASESKSLGQFLDQNL